jgi:hypothetical protein
VRRLRVQLTDQCPDGRSDELLTIYTRDPDYRELTVPVTAVRRDRQQYQVTPAEVRLEVVPGKPTPTTLVLIQDRDGRPVEIERVDCGDPAVTTRFADGPHPTAAVRIGVAKDRTPAPQSTVTVQLRAPVAETITVPVVVGP